MIPFSYHTDDGTQIAAYRWLTSRSQPEGIVQIAHGMAEHAKRYHEFATFLTTHGWNVYANDHRGHGETAGQIENLGYFAEQNGWELVVDDLYTLTMLAKQNHPDLPLILIGHSMGSFLVRCYIQKYGTMVQGVILSGTSTDPGLVGVFGRVFAKMLIQIKGKKARSKLFHQLSFGQYNKPFEPTRTAYDWLTRDQEVVTQYINDPFCGEMSTLGFYYDLLRGMKRMDQPAQLAQVPKQLPIFLIAGEEDPVGKQTKAVLQTYQRLCQAGLQQVSYRFYPKSRHEILNELNKEEVYQDILQWIQRISEGV